MRHRSSVFLLASLIMVAAVSGLYSANPGQIHFQSAAAAAGALPAFEVISIKPNRSGETHSVFQFLPGRFTATNIPAIALMAGAYQVKEFQISGGPAWVRSEKFDIQAKEPDELAEEIRELPPGQRGERNGLLMQSMLMGQFKLKVRHETRELPIYALVVTKNGPKIEKAKPGVGVEWHNRQLLFSRGYITAQGVTMADFARVLSQQLGRTVVDQSGLKGNYQLDLHWTPDLGQGDFSRPPAETLSAPGTPGSSDLTGPSIFTAIQEQLGLKLESTKGPVEMIVIEHIERPSEN